MKKNIIINYMSFLREIDLRNAIRHVKYNKESTNPIRMNMTENGKYLLLAHGRTEEPYNFIVPKNINFITITKVSSNCKLNYSFDKEIKDFYKAGNTIFQNNDLNENLTENGEKLMAKLNSLFPGKEIYYFKNHLEDSIANEMFLDFSRTGTTEGSARSIGMVDLLENKNFNIKNVINLSNNKKYTVKQILLSTLLSMYSDNINNKSKKKTFIVCACRGFSGKNNTSKYLARTVSGTEANTTPRLNSNRVSSTNSSY